VNQRVVLSLSVLLLVSLSVANPTTDIVWWLTALFPLCSVHLYYLFPCLEEGGLATYRTAIVQNQHLAMLAKVNMTSDT
jgi:hypothetical protein